MLFRSLGGHANDSYDAARALVLDAIAPPEAGAGAGWLGAVPARDWLFCLRVTAESLPSVPLLKIVAEKSHAEDAYPISDEVYWVRGGAWEVFPIVLSEEGAQVTPSEAFFEALNALGGDPPAGPGGAADGE